MKLTKRALDTLKPGSTDLVVFDDELRGFGVRVKPSGVASWLIQYRNKHGRSRRYTIGSTAKLTPDEARKRARKLFVAIEDGSDPADDRRAARSAITVAQLCDEYLAAGKGRIKASTLAMDRSRVEKHVKPLLGSRTVASLTPADMEKFLRDVTAGRTATKPAKLEGGKRKRGGLTTGGAGVASRTLGMLGTVLERAVRDGVLPKNPARGIARPPDNPRKPPFSFDTITALGKAMREAEAEGENVTGLRAVTFLLLSGCRRMEALPLTWGVVDCRDRCLRFADTKSGAQIRPLGRAALDHLARFEPEDAKPDSYVFPSESSKKGHFIGLPRVWARICGRAGIEGVSIHGARHWFASAAAAMGYSELVIAGLLGHHVKGVTARYATAPDSALLAAADNVSAELAACLAGERKAGNVVRFTPRSA